MSEVARLLACYIHTGCYVAIYMYLASLLYAATGYHTRLGNILQAFVHNLPITTSLFTDITNPEIATVPVFSTTVHPLLKYTRDKLCYNHHIATIVAAQTAVAHLLLPSSQLSPSARSSFSRTRNDEITFIYVATLLYTYIARCDSLVGWLVGWLLGWLAWLLGSLLGW